MDTSSGIGVGVGPGRVPETDREPKRRAQPGRAALAARTLTVSALTESAVADERLDEDDWDFDDLSPDGWEISDSSDDLAEDSDDGYGRDTRRAVITFGEWDSRLQAAVTPPSDLRDLYQSRQFDAVLASLADQLIAFHGDAIRSRTSREAYLALAATTQTTLAAWVGDGTSVDNSKLSRYGPLLVGCRWGTVPLDFFTWGHLRPGESHLAAYHNLLLEIVDDPDGAAKTQARAAVRQAKVPESMVEALRKEVPAVRAFLDRRPWVEYLQRHSEQWSSDRMSQLLPSPIDRGERLRRALVACAVELP